jgi:alpha-amylase/alpha-mannosidase (GH57 family)
MRKIHVAILWHQHQPMYATRSGVCRLPWTRLHAIKDYVGMALLARAHPEMRQVVNLVPSLMDQLEGYAEGRLTDEWLEISRKEAGALTEADKRLMLKEFFAGAWDRMIRPHKRYAELLARREGGPAERVMRQMTEQDWRDLQVWQTLAWYHPLVLEERGELAELAEKGRDFTEDERRRVVEAQAAVIGEVLPLHRECQEAGLVELTVTPYFHPIVPLLCRMESARVALPDLPLPSGIRESWAADARWHLGRAVARYEELFGRRPRGMWPSEGSVSPEAVALMGEAGIEWCASDEEVLGASLGTRFGRDERGNVDRAELLYAPYTVWEDAGRAVRMVFRDHDLSDRIGFQYCRWPDGEAAAADLVGRLEQIRVRGGGVPPLVSIILDGENAWEFYERQGVPFLSALYRGIVASETLEPTTVSAYLDTFGAERRIEKLFSGSWIGHNFATWVGHAEKNAGWELLAPARRALKGAGDAAGEAAWRSFYAAEGSDWFWWYGDDHSSAHKREFDEIFRAHLWEAYEAAGLEAPEALGQSLLRAKRLYTEPTYLLDVVVDGRETSFFEWRDAGHYNSMREEGTMHRASGRAISDLFYGGSHRALLLRLDPEVSNEGAVSAQWRARLVLTREGVRSEVNLEIAPDGGVQMTLRHGGEERPSGGRACRGRIVEAAIPWEDLGFEPGAEFGFCVEVRIDGDVVQRLPERGTIRWQVPEEDYEARHWVV